VQARRLSSLLVLPIDDPNPYDKRYSTQELDQLEQDMEAKLAEAAELRRGVQRNSGDGASRTALQKRLRLSNELASLSAKLAIVDDQGNPRSYCMGVQDKEEPQDARLLVRGEIDQRGQLVPRGFPAVLSRGDEKIRSGSGRLELADWIASEQNPLTSRVMVNRIWQSMIGQGIVTSTENFGVTGQVPSHPELLDYLAIRFVESGWSVKSLVREIASSRVYRISSAFNERAHQYDPDNALLWRANPRRLDAEAIRDAMLVISGEIDFDRPRGSEVAKAGYQRVRDGFLGDPREKMREAMTSMMAQRSRRVGQGSRPGFGGQRGRLAQEYFRNRFRPGRRPVMPPRAMRPTGPAMAMESAAELYKKYVTNALDMYDAKYRSVYLPIVRDQVPRSLEVFDFPDASMVSGSRESSNTANQALYLMNNPMVIQQSESMAKRLQNEHSKMTDQVAAAFMLAFGRPPTSGEREATVDFVRNAGVRDPAQRNETLALVCQSLFASAEFRYID
jgi:hypothetical protein